MTRVLVGEFHPLVELGLRRVLSDEGCCVVRDPRAISRRVVDDVRPDAVIVDLDDPAASSAAEGLVADYPGLPVLECSSSTPRLRVFPAYQFGKSYDVPLTIDGLIRAVAGP